MSEAWLLFWSICTLTNLACLQAVTYSVKAKHKMNRWNRLMCLLLVVLGPPTTFLWICGTVRWAFKPDEPEAPKEGR